MKKLSYAAKLLKEQQTAKKAQVQPMSKAEHLASIDERIELARERKDKALVSFLLLHRKKVEVLAE
jgi:hypothetical protein